MSKPQLLCTIKTELKPWGVMYVSEIHTINSTYTKQHSILKINSKSTIDLNVRAKTLRLLEETKKIFATLGQTRISQEPGAPKH